MRWDDLQFVLAVEREGSLAGASRLLGINYSTAHRRLEQIERTMGMRIFNRRREGYSLTSTARRIEAEVLTLERRIIGADVKLSGTLRVSTSQLMGLYVLPRMFEEFLRNYPSVGLKVAITDELTNLTRSDTDVVIRATAAPPAYLSGLNLGPVSYAAYTRKDQAARSQPLHAYDWIDFVGRDASAPLARWRQDLVAGIESRCQFDSAAALCEAALAGLGAAVLPCLVGEIHPGLARISEIRHEREFNLWILTHADLRRSARVRSFMRFIQAQIKFFLSEIPAPRA